MAEWGLARPPVLAKLPRRADPSGTSRRAPVERRACLAWMTLALWVALPDRVIMPLLAGDGDIAPLWSLKPRPRFPWLRRLRPG